MSIEFAGKTVAITGIASGFGGAIAKRFLAGGARVYGCDIAAERLQDAARQLPFSPAVVDLSDEEAATRWVADVEVRSGAAIDVVVNNAGGPLGIPYAPIEEFPIAEWDRIFAANVRAAFIVCRAAASSMKRSGGGRIILISSGAGLRPSLSGLHAYTSTKHAMVGLTRQLAVEFGASGVTVNSVAPGLQMTDEKKVERWNSYSPAKQAAIMGRIALGRLGQPDDIAKAVVFFASDLAEYITGEVLSVNGGSF